MEVKKTNKANINKKKASFLMLGLVCATSLTLMSFEYRNFDVSRDLYSESDEKITDCFLTYEEVEIFKPQPKKQHVTKNNTFIEVTNDTNLEKEIDLVDDNIEVKNDENEWDFLDDIEFGDDPGDISEPVLDKIELIAEKMPAFPGGSKAMYDFLSAEINYPTFSRDRGTEGVAYVRFTVEKDGSISDVTVLKGVDKHIDKESKRVVKSMPKWTPGENMGKKVRVYYTLPIKYTFGN